MWTDGEWGEAVVQVFFSEGNFYLITHKVAKETILFTLWLK